MPANSEPTCAMPMNTDSRNASVSSRRPRLGAARGLGLLRGQRAHLGPPPHRLTPRQDQAVHGEERRAGERLGELSSQKVLEDEPDDAGRDSRDDQQPGQSLVRALDLACPQRADEALDDAHPVVAEVHDQRDRCRHVQRDEEREIEGLVGRLGADEVVPAEPGRHQHGVAETGDREQLGDAL